MFACSRLGLILLPSGLTPVWPCLGVIRGGLVVSTTGKSVIGFRANHPATV